jgi:site-specific recombinase XerD
MGSVRKRGNAYYLDFYAEGRRFRKRIGKDKRIAELALKDAEVKIANGQAGFYVKKDIDLSKLFSEYLKFCQTNNSPNTCLRYQEVIINFQEFLQKYFPYVSKASHLNLKMFEDYKAHRKNAGAKSKTINLELTTIRSIFTLAIKWGFMEKNPTDNLVLCKENDCKRPRFLTKEECEQLLANCGEDLYPIFFTFLNTGMRRGELINLEWNDIDFKRRKIIIRSKDKWKPKTDYREIPINDRLMDLLQDHKTHNGASPYVFYREKGRKFDKNYLRLRLMGITKECGFPDVTQVHSLRHTFASHLVMNGVDLPTVQKLMGHANINTTMIYSHLAPEHLNNAVNKLGL